MGHQTAPAGLGGPGPEPDRLRAPHAFPQGLKQTIAWFQENWDRIDAAARFGPGMSSAVRHLVCQG